jgi:site-specific recombinase XerD
MAIISMLYATGIRVSELCNLDRTDIKEQNSFTVVGKGGKARLCFFDDRTRCYLNAYLQLRSDDKEALFISTHNDLRITPGNIQEIFRRTWKRAGLSSPVHPHTLRHSFATNLLRNNANIRYVKDMLGHASLDTTMMYTHVVDEDLRRVYMAHHSV